MTTVTFTSPRCLSAPPSLRAVNVASARRVSLGCAGIVRLRASPVLGGFAPSTLPPISSRRASSTIRRAIPDVTEADWEKEVIEASKTTPVMVDVWATWCGPCKLVAAALPMIEKQYGDAVKIVKVDADPNPKIIEQFKVYGLPTLMLFKNGRLVEGSKREGAIPAAGISKWLDQYGVVASKV